MELTRVGVEQWVAAYERLWRRPGTDRLGELFAAEAAYLPSPWRQALAGLAAIADFWEAERVGPDEAFTLVSDVLAVEGRTAVVRVAVDYGTGNRWRDLWVLGFADDGRCGSFEERPFAPDQRDGH